MSSSLNLSTYTQNAMYLLKRANDVFRFNSKVNDVHTNNAVAQTSI